MQRKGDHGGLFGKKASGGKLDLALNDGGRRGTERKRGNIGWGWDISDKGASRKANGMADA